MNTTRAMTLLLVALLPSSRDARGDDLDPAAIRERLTLLWDSLESISFTVEEYPKGAVDGDGGIIRTFTIASGNRRHLKATAIGEGGKRIPMEEIRADGRMTYTVVPPSELAGPSWTVIIENQSVEHDELQHSISSALWLFAPGGRPLHTLLDEGGSLRPGPSRGEGDPRVILTGEYRGMPVTCDLDPLRDYLPTRVVLEGRNANHEYRTTAYTRDNGRWFPAEGFVRTKRKSGRVEEWTFKVSGLQVNRTVDPRERFGRPAIPRGAAVIDRAKGVNYVEGGARALAESRAARASGEEAPAVGTPIAVSRSSPFFPWRIVLWGSASVAFAAGIALRMRGLLGGR